MDIDQVWIFWGRRLGYSRSQLLQHVADHVIADSGRRRFLLHSDHEGRTEVTVAAHLARPRPPRRFPRNSRRAHLPHGPAVDVPVPVSTPCHVSVSSEEGNSVAGSERCVKDPSEDPAAAVTPFDDDEDDDTADGFEDVKVEHMEGPDDDTIRRLGSSTELQCNTAGVEVGDSLPSTIRDTGATPCKEELPTSPEDTAFPSAPSLSQAPRAPTQPLAKDYDVCSVDFQVSSPRSRLSLP